MEEAGENDSENDSGGELENDQELVLDLSSSISEKNSEKFFISSESESDEEKTEEDTQPDNSTSKSRGKNRAYVIWENFDHLEAFAEFWEAEKANWRIDWRANSSSGEVEYWNCKFSTRCKKDFKCPVRLKIIYSAADNSIVLEKSTEEHDHIPQKKSGLTEENKERIRQLMKQGMEPARIHVILQQEKVEVLPTLRQVQALVGRFRASEGNKPFTLQQLKNYCNANSTCPEGDDTVAVVAFEIEDAQKFFVMWTTNRLLNKQLFSEQLQLDSTFSLAYNIRYCDDFPVQVLGHSDKDKHFHPTFLAMSTTENAWVYEKICTFLRDDLDYTPKYILGDGAASISLACTRVFPSSTRLMCFAHVVRNLKKRLKGLTEEQRKRILSDVHHLQVSRNAEEFMNVSALMLQSWRENGHDSLADYFNGNWIASDVNRWYEGASGFCSSNNGLESINAGIKKAHTLRKRMKFEAFLECAEKIVRYWSVNSKDPIIFPKIPPSVYKEAFVQFSTRVPFWGKTKINNEVVYYFSSSKRQFKTAEEMKEASECCFREPETWPDWETYVEHRFDVYRATKSRLGEFFECSCQVGSKKSVCKHATCAMVKEKIIHFPPGCKDLKETEPLQGLRKRGRPRAADVGRPPKAKKQNRF